MPEVKHKFAETLRTMRVTLGWSQGGLAKQVGIRAATLSHYETGRREPGLAILIRLANVLMISVDDLVNGIEEKLCPK